MFIRQKPKVFTSVVALILVLGLAASLSPVLSAQQSSQVTIGLVGTPSDPFNPITQIALIDHWIQSILYMTLVTYNSQGQVVPYLAQSYNISPNGLTYTFILRNNAKWSDGVPITANDVVFTLQAYIQQSTRVTSLLPFAEKSNSTFSGYTLNMSTVETPNNYTVILKPSYSEPALVAFFADFFYILPEHVDEGQNLTTNTYINSHLVTSGPWYLASSSNYVPGSYLTLTANPYFPLGEPAVKTLTLQFFQTASAAEAALRSGSIQMMAAVPYSDVNSLKQAGFTTFVAPEYRVMFLQFNMNQNLSSGEYNPLSNLLVREALGYATNITALVNSISSGYFKVWGQAEPYGMTYLGYPAWNSSLPDPMFPYNTSMANKLLDEAGYPWNGQTPRLNITMITLATIPYFVSAAQILKSEWAQVGVNLNIKLEQTTQWVYDSFSAPQPKSWNIDLYDLTEPADPFYPANFLFGPGSGNAGHFVDQTIMNLIYNVSNRVTSGQGRAQVFQEIDYLANKQVPYLFLASETEVDAWSPQVSFTDGIGGMMSLPLSIYALSYPTTPTTSSVTSTATSAISSSTPSPSTSPSTAKSTTSTLAIVTVVIIVIIIILAALLMRRR